MDNRNMILLIIVLLIIITYLFFLNLLHFTQSQNEPQLVETKIPFLNATIGILQHRANYLATLREKYHMPIHTLRMPFQRLYIVHSPELIHSIQSKSNARTFVPNLLDFGMMFSGLNQSSQSILRNEFGIGGNGFTMSVHKYLLSGPSLTIATQAAVGRLACNIGNLLQDAREDGLLDFIRSVLTVAMTGAIYGPQNPYDDPQVKQSWKDFLPGINHLLYSPLPSLTARKALRARSHVIDAFRSYFRTGGHLQAFPMIAEMYETNIRTGLAPNEAAKMELATSLAMLSSGAITAFWLLFQIFSNDMVKEEIREELIAIARDTHESAHTKVLRLSNIRENCPTLVAMLNETLRYHSTVINIKEVQYDTTLADRYLLKKGGIVMIPGQSVHHSTDIWGPDARIFDHRRFLSSNYKKNLSNTSAFRPFGAGVSMCPGRHFSLNVILSLVAMLVLQYDILPVGGAWIAPSKRKADLWNAMPKPDLDINVRFVKRVEEKEAKWKFIWDGK